MEAEGTGVTPPPLKEKVWFINTLKAALQDLAKEGIIDPNVLKSNVQEVDFEEAYEVAKNETAHQIATAKERGSTSTDARLSLDDEKSVFYTSLAYIFEKLASKGLLDRRFMRKTLLTGPGIALQAKFDSQLTKIFRGDQKYEESEGGVKAKALPLKEKGWFINTLKAAVQDLAKQGVIDPIALKSNSQEGDFEDAYEISKYETAHQITTAKDRGSTSTDAQLSLDDEKSVFYSSLAYLLEKWGSRGLIDANFMQKTLLTGPGIALQAKFDSQLTKMLQDGGTNEVNVGSVKAKRDL